MSWWKPLLALVPLLLWFPTHPGASQEGKLDASVSQPRSPKEARRQWEYKQVWPCKRSEVPRQSEELQTELNDEGEKGWELVSFVATFPGGRGDCFVATFKRERLR
jgi:hypothetical protein